MTPAQEQLIFSLVRRDITPEEFKASFDSTSGARFCFDLLSDAIERKDAHDVAMTLIACFVFGFTDEYLPLLLELSTAKWHSRHEDVVSALGDLHSAEAVDALYDATQWVPDYLDFDDSRALATKAVWALGGIADERAQHALERLTTSEEPILRDGALNQLELRRTSER